MEALKTKADKMVYRGAYDFYMRADVIGWFENHWDRENYKLGRDRARAMTNMAPLKSLNPQEVSQFCLALVEKIRKDNAVDSAPVNASDEVNEPKLQDRINNAMEALSALQEALSDHAPDGDLNH